MKKNIFNDLKRQVFAKKTITGALTIFVAICLVMMSSFIILLPESARADFPSWEKIADLDDDPTKDHNGAEFSPNGSWVAYSLGDTDGKLVIVETATWTVHKYVSGFPSKNIPDLRFSPNGSWIAYLVGSGTDNLIVKRTWGNWGAVLDNESLASGSVRSLDYSPNGTFIAVGMSDGKCYVYNTNSWNYDTITAGTDELYSVGFSMNGTYLAIGSLETDVYVYDATDDFSVQKQFNTASRVWEISFSHNSTWLAVPLHDGDVDVYTTHGAWNKLATLTAPTSSQRASCFSHDSTFLATGGTEKPVYIFNTSDWSHSATTGSIAEEVNKVNFSKDGQYLAVSVNGGSGNVTIFNATFQPAPTSATLSGLTNDRITFQGVASTTVWSNSSGLSETLSLVLTVGDENISGIRIEIGCINDTGPIIGSSNFSVELSSDGSTWTGNTETFTNGTPSANITITTASNWTNNDWCNGANPFTGGYIASSDTIYIRFKFTIPATAEVDTYYSVTKTDWTVYVGIV